MTYGMGKRRESGVAPTKVPRKAQGNCPPTSQQDPRLGNVSNFMCGASVLICVGCAFTTSRIPGITSLSISSTSSPTANKGSLRSTTVYTVMLSSVASTIGSHHPINLNLPLVAQAFRRSPGSNLFWQHPQSFFQRRNPTTLYYQLLVRWKRNFARLYARRILELAAASAASQRLRSHLESEFIAKPEQWKNWQAKNWEETALTSVGNSKLGRSWMAMSRLVNLAVLASPMMVLYPLSYINSNWQDRAWSYALWGIEQAGPTWIKLVQWASTRQDLFSPEFCQYFGKLRDETEGHSWKETQTILNQELGSAMSAVTLDPTPIGSGCIAQVYRGTLTEPTPSYPKGTKLAVKVQHPGIWRKVCVDFYILYKMAKWLEDLPYLNLHYLSLSDSVRQFRDVMLPQLDLTLEAGHLRRFNQDFSNDDRVVFPRALDELTTTRVLTETFCEGTPIMEYTKPGTLKAARQKLALIGLETTLKMIFLNDFVHGDLHPGNILVSGTYPNLKMVLLDCGLVLELGPEQHVNLVKVLGAFTKQDGHLAGQLMVDMNSESQATPRDVEMFIRGIEQICIVDKDHNFIEKVGDYITDICYLACVHKVKLEPTFVNAALAVEIMEGLASALYAEMHVKEIALPLIFKAEVMHRLGLR